MFKSISKILLTGFITLLPVILTVYLLYWLAVSSENVMGTALRWILPNATYFPGLGMIAGLHRSICRWPVDEGHTDPSAVFIR